jgi:cohesin complex subunit SA-1/2
MNPSAALQSTAEDFLDSLSQTPGPAQAELINCILRACGCNDSVDADEVMDYDGVVDTLDTFTESLKQVCFFGHRYSGPDMNRHDIGKFTCLPFDI